MPRINIAFKKKGLKCFKIGNTEFVGGKQDVPNKTCRELIMNIQKYRDFSLIFNFGEKKKLIIDADILWDTEKDHNETLFDIAKKMIECIEQRIPEHKLTFIASKKEKFYLKKGIPCHGFHIMVDGMTFEADDQFRLEIQDEIRNMKYDDIKEFEFDKKVTPFGTAGISLLFTTLKDKKKTFKIPWFIKQGDIKTEFTENEFMELYAEFLLTDRKYIRKQGRLFDRDVRKVPEETHNLLPYKFNYRLYLEATFENRNHAHWVIGCVTAKAFLIPREEFIELHKEFFPGDGIGEAIEKFEGNSMDPHLKSTLTICQKTRPDIKFEDLFILTQKVNTVDELYRDRIPKTLFEWSLKFRQVCFTIQGDQQLFVFKMMCAEKPYRNVRHYQYVKKTPVQLNQLLNNGFKVITNGKNGPEVDLLAFKNVVLNLNKHGLLKQFTGTTFIPTFSEQNNECDLLFNEATANVFATYRPKKIIKFEDTAMYELLYEQMARGDQYKFDYFMSAVALKLFKPEKKWKKLFELFSETRGSGKSFTQTWLLRVLTTKAVSIGPGSSEGPFSKFNGFVRKMLLYIWDDHTYITVKKMVDYRSIVSQEELNLESKNQNMLSTVQVYIDYLGSTNVKFALPLQAQDRRTEVIHFKEERFDVKKCKIIDEIELREADYIKSAIEFLRENYYPGKSPLFIDVSLSNRRFDKITLHEWINANANKSNLNNFVQNIMQNEIDLNIKEFNFLEKNMLGYEKIIVRAQYIQELWIDKYGKRRANELNTQLKSQWGWVKDQRRSTKPLGPKKKCLFYEIEHSEIKKRAKEKKICMNGNILVGLIKESIGCLPSSD